MRVWLVTVGEPLPLDPGSPRLLRAGILAERLWERGHQVVWWTSAFDHTAKRHRCAGVKAIQLRERYHLRLLHGPGYRRNVSLARLLDHRAVAHEFSRQAIAETPPDIIVASFPTIELSAASTSYGLKRGIPIVLDVRDLWPDIFLNILPAWFRPFGQIALAPFTVDAPGVRRGNGDCQQCTTLRRLGAASRTSQVRAGRSRVSLWLQCFDPESSRPRRGDGLLARAGHFEYGRAATRLFLWDIWSATRHRYCYQGCANT